MGKERPGNVLLVDNDPIAGDLIVKVLRKHLDCNVYVARDCGSGIAAALSGKFELMIADLSLNGASCLKMIKTIRTMMPSLVIVGMTTDTSDTDLNLTRRLGVAEILYKPFKINALLDAVAGASCRG